MRHLTLGSRGSALALWQAEFVASALRRAHGLTIEIKVIKTAGDKLQHAPVAQLGRKGIFIKELEESLLEGTIDLAVHSMKDVPTRIPAGLTIGAVCERADPRDCFLSHRRHRLADLPAGARVGTSSVRRQAQLRRNRSDLQLLDLRGNVDTRVRKLEEGQYDAIVVAKAGIDRLGWTAKITETLSTDIMLPAAGQGAMGIEVRADDHTLLGWVEAINDWPTQLAVEAERALLREVEGGCQLPVAALAQVERDHLLLEACVLSVDGEDCVRDKIEGPAQDPAAIGSELGKKLLRAGADRILKVVVRL